jgi:SAM-dependent methyltransferase
LLAVRRALARQKREWEELAAVDPLWAILSDPSRRGGRWDAQEFFRTGEADAEHALAIAAELGRPARRGRALDFGCGVGRVTRALAARFEEAIGADLSERMVEQARTLNAHVANARFVVNGAPDLAGFDDGWFDLVYSRIVLQHLGSAADALRYVKDFLRVVRPDGIVVFQLPAGIPLRNRLHLRRRAWRLLRALGGDSGQLHRLGLSPIRVIGVPQEEVVRVVTSSGAAVARAEPDDAVAGLTGFQYYVVPGPDHILAPCTPARCRSRSRSSRTR